MKQLIIGVPLKHREKEGRINTYLRDEVKNAIIDNCKTAVVIGIVPPNSPHFIDEENEIEVSKNIEDILSSWEKQNLTAQLNLCDGVILQGGKYSDSYEIFVAKYCYKNNIPCLAICAGQNNLARAVGGTIKTVNSDIHKKPKLDYVHDVCVLKNTQFYNIVKKQIFKVNSRHGNAIENPSELKVSAYDEFGNIEVVEATNKTFYMGVRFHPESLYKTDKNHNAIFKAFIKACTL